jgi:hypothetical protein
MPDPEARGPRTLADVEDAIRKRLLDRCAVDLRSPSPRPPRPLGEIVEWF